MARRMLSDLGPDPVGGGRCHIGLVRASARAGWPLWSDAGPRRTGVHGTLPYRGGSAGETWVSERCTLAVHQFAGGQLHADGVDPLDLPLHRDPVSLPENRKMVLNVRAVTEHHEDRYVEEYFVSKRHLRETPDPGPCADVA